MAESRSLMSMVNLWGRNLPTLVMPPGSAVILAGIIAIAGWEIGLNMPYAVSDILAVRAMGKVAWEVATGATGWQQAFSAIYATSAFPRTTSNVSAQTHGFASHEYALTRSVFALSWVLRPPSRLPLIESHRSRNHSTGGVWSGA